MHETQQGLAPTPGDSSWSALNFLHGQLLAAGGGSRDLAEFLGGLAAAFEARGAGLATIEAGGPVLQALVPDEPSIPKLPLPWQVETAWLEKFSPDHGAVRLRASDQASYLIAAWKGAGIAGGLIWLEGGNDREWSSGDEAALSLGALLLGRRFAPGQVPTRWAAQLDHATRASRMDLAAQVTRRLAHDFGNVMTGILGFTELALTQQQTGNLLLQTYLSEAHKAAQNGALFTHQLRLLSRRQSASSNITNLAALFAEEEKRCRAVWGASPVLTMDAAADLPPIALEGETFRQAFNALLDNAREACQGVATASIAVSAQRVELTSASCRDWYGDVRPGPHVEIRVADTGSGIDPEVARRLFAEPFLSTKTRKRGFGLALAYGIVHAHRGGLDLQPGPGGGTVARIVLPAAPVAPPKKPPRVLVVDDDPLILQFVCTTLQRAGYEVEQASSAADAFLCYTAAAPDLVLSDVAMPRESGIELARRLLGQDANVRLLFMSGKVPSEMVETELVARRFQLLPKPFRPDGLLKAVREALRRPSRGSEERLAMPSQA